MRKKLCDLGEGFWYGNLPDLTALDEDGYDMHIRAVINVMEENEPFPCQAV